jgi:hypothetical protein
MSVVGIIAVDALHISVRLDNRLKSDGVRFLSDLLPFDWRAFILKKGTGRKTVDELVAVLRDYGFEAEFPSDRVKHLIEARRKGCGYVQDGFCDDCLRYELRAGALRRVRTTVVSAEGP